MRIVNSAGRASVLTDDGLVDIESASGGAFSADPQALFDRWDDLRVWAAAHRGGATAPFEEDRLKAPVPRPRQVFAIGLNYRDHAAESGMALPDTPVVFTKFPACITGPCAAVDLPPGSVDFETELVVVLGRDAHRTPASRAWEHVAGLTVGQDLSERQLQLKPPVPQFSLGKSYPGFAPMGPALVTPDEFPDRDDIVLGCRLNGEQMQNSRTSEMVFPVADLIAYLSSIVPLYAGDVIFTGTPAGIGMARDPARFLRPGDELVTTAEAIGSMRTTFVSTP
ncbi:fumarylacetoacetate hydrolase family protein [Umezawaea sp. Da 62-37]|uniref:fumarylacetoacetate hydrolase family protein n=1 Tax=Umezawaea sp. Da 62-37 TaxID=3075927 RepID=UPI0028F71799|nr:fumarylacetoacetate hydrolase family protein [Umezawaea sp. Da 62-37]WNV83011.1 fumarylacetoacetate hydrolase family protein [Umezawaea sp. Da 62-37]